MANSIAHPTCFRFSVNFHFGLTDLIEDLVFQQNDPDASFQEVSGLSVEYETQIVKDGAIAQFPKKLPVRANYADLVLKRGIIRNSKILNWIISTLGNAQVQIKPANVEVNLLNERGEVILNFHFINAWPKKWSISDFNSMESSLVIETLVLTYDYLKINQI